MAGGIDWFRWHHGSVNDPKFGLVAKKAGVSTAEVIATWAFLLEQASAADDRGNPGQPDFDAIDFALGMNDGAARRIYERMRERGLLDPETGRVAAWEKRQPKRERTDDSSTERVKAFRARQRQETPTGDTETPCNATERQKTPRGEERREEGTTPPYPPVPGGEPVDNSGEGMEHEASGPLPRQKRERKPAIEFKTFLEQCRNTGEPAISAYQPMLDYAEAAGLPMDFVQLCWDEFKRRHLEGGGREAKRQADWRRTFLNALQGGWFKLWWVPEPGRYELTSAGLQAKAVRDARQAASERAAA